MLNFTACKSYKERLLRRTTSRQDFFCEKLYSVPTFFEMLSWNTKCQLQYVTKVAKVSLSDYLCGLFFLFGALQTVCNYIYEMYFVKICLSKALVIILHQSKAGTDCTQKQSVLSFVKFYHFGYTTNSLVSLQIQPLLGRASKECDKMNSEPFFSERLVVTNHQK